MKKIQFEIQFIEPMLGTKPSDEKTFTETSFLAP